MNQDHIFIHTLDTKGEAEIAAIRTDRKGRILTAYSTSNRPFHLMWNDVRTDILDEKFDDAFIVVAINAEQTQQYLRSKNDGKASFPRKTWIDIFQLAWPMVYFDILADKKFDTLCKNFQVSNKHPDNCTSDCAALAEVYWAMMKRYKTALLGEEAIRDYGGLAVNKVRNWFGV